MHIAIEGMDGAGKTSQAKAVAHALQCEFIAKSFHEMNDPSGKYDNFFTINQYTSSCLNGIYGLRKNYYLKKIRHENVVTDRFYISNYWSRSEDYNISFFKEVSYVWGKPDLMILLYAEPEILYNRIYARNADDKDLWKPQLAINAYHLMREFAISMSFEVLVINTSELCFDYVTNIILKAVNDGIDSCCEKFSEYCSAIKPNVEINKIGNTRFYIKSGELIRCVSDEEDLTLPQFVSSLGEGCFEGCKYLKKIVLHSNIEKISDFAFENSHISIVDISKDNKAFQSVGKFMFDGTGKKLLKYFSDENAGVIYLPEHTEIIGNRAFAKCNSVIKIVCKENLEEIQYGAFVDCSELKEIIVQGYRLKTIRDGAFVGCCKLLNIELGGSRGFVIEDDCIKTSMGDIVLFLGQSIDDVYSVPECNYIYPYAYCEKLDVCKLILPDSAVKIGAYAFKDCKIREIQLGNKIRDVGEQSFAGTDSKIVCLSANHVPEIWKDSFDPKTEIIVPKSSGNDYIVNDDWKEKIIKERLITKHDAMVCGSACLKYMFYESGNADIEVPNMYWNMELARFIHANVNWSVLLKYFDSRLMKDYSDKKSEMCNEITDMINNYIENGGKFEEEKINVEILCKYCNEWEWITLNVRSEILFDDEKMIGKNHYVILDSCNNDIATIISPGNKYIFRQWVSTEKLLKMMTGNGQWILLAGKKDADY